MKLPQLRHNELYLLGLLLAKCDDHIGTVFDLKELATESFSVKSVRTAAGNLDGLGLASLSQTTMPGQRRSDDMLMLTPLGFKYAFSHELPILEAVMDGGSTLIATSVRSAFDRFRIELADPRSDKYLESRYVDEGYVVEDDSSNLEIAIDSSTWTGTQFVLTDAKVIKSVKDTAVELRNTIYSMHFPSNSETENLQKLADALVAICEMAEPEVSIIDRILASPKFKAYARLVVLVATIRGALGI